VLGGKNAKPWIRRRANTMKGRNHLGSSLWLQMVAKCKCFHNELASLQPHSKA
jgi:hypothetical protein